MNPIKHVAIIMDGNGRWGIKNKKSRNLGHKEGLKTVESILKETIFAMNIIISRISNMHADITLMVVIIYHPK